MASGTQPIGTAEQVAERIVAYRKLGVDLILTGFLHFQEELEAFGEKVLPLVRELRWLQASTLPRCRRRRWLRRHRDRHTSDVGLG